MIGILLFVVIALAESVASQGCLAGPTQGAPGVGVATDQCLGKHQSPIDINSRHVNRVVLSPLKMNGFDATTAATLSNNGHTAMMTIDSNRKPTISGGPLKGVYRFEQLHFHWGANNSVGSETTINARTFPMESHFVFFKEDYKNINAALAHKDGLCVLAFLYELQNNNNDKYNTFVRTLSKITRANTNAKILNPPALFDLMPSALSTYYTYFGSLTTPPCSEAVTWIEFDNTLKISRDQMRIFRTLTDVEGKILVNNFRAIQPLGDRVVLYNTAKVNDKAILELTRKLIPDNLFNVLNLLSSQIKRRGRTV